MGTFALVVLIAMTVNGVVGFASNVIALPILSAFMDLSTAVTILAIISVTQSIALAIQNRKFILWKLVAKLTIINVLGMPIGMYLVNVLPEQKTKLVLGCFVLFVAIRQIYLELKAKAGEEDTQKPVHPANLIFVFLSGMVNGAFACGGPLLIIYLSKLRLPVEEYRAVNFAYSLVAMGLPAVQRIAMHQYVAPLTPYVAVGLAMVALSVVFSAVLIRKINKKQFMLLVNGALVLSGLLMVVQNL